MGDESGKYKILTFMIGNQCYGLPVANVGRVLRAAEVTPAPSSRNMLLGLINIGGNILPVVNPYVLFSISDNKMSIHADDCFLFIDIQSVKFILLVNSIREIFFVSHGELAQIDGGNMITINNKIIFLPNIDKEIEGKITECSPLTALQVKREAI